MTDACDSTQSTQRAPSILVVDDEPDVRELVKDILESGGYRVLTAANGREALACLGRSDVDLLITDLVMPEQEGIDTIRILRQQKPGLKILAISGSFGPYLEVARMLGAQGALRKPFCVDSLIEKVESLLGVA